MAEAEKKEVKTKRSTAQKRQIQDQKKRVRNRAFRSQVRTAVRQFREGIASNDSDKLRAALSEIYSLVDKGVNKSILKRNQASRIKARLTAALHAKTA